LDQQEGDGLTGIVGVESGVGLDGGRRRGLAGLGQGPDRLGDLPGVGLAGPPLPGLGLGYPVGLFLLLLGFLPILAVRDGLADRVGLDDPASAAEIDVGPTRLDVDMQFAGMVTALCKN